MPSWFDAAIVDTGRLPLFLCFVAFIVTFVVTRAITRLIRTGRGPLKDNVTDSGLHVHHAVPGVIILITGAFVAVGASGATGWADVAGVMVGIGTSLVLDEFALILRLEDVYWAEEGRFSVEVVALAISCLGLVILGLNPFLIDVDHGRAVFVSALVSLAINFGFVAVNVLKGKYRLALLGVFFSPLAMIGAIRLARPNSPWAQKRYDERKVQRATIRAARFDARYGPIARRAGEFIAGAPNPSPAKEDTPAADSSPV